MDPLINPLPDMNSMTFEALEDKPPVAPARIK